MEMNETTLAAATLARRLAKRERLLRTARGSAAWTPWIVMLEAGLVFVAAILVESRGLASHTFFPAVLFSLMSGHVVHLHRRLDALATLAEWERDTEAERP